jgi:hypothetical protein
MKTNTKNETSACFHCQIFPYHPIGTSRFNFNNLNGHRYLDFKNADFGVKGERTFSPSPGVGRSVR